MNYKISLDEQIKLFTNIILKNKIINEVLNNGFVDGINDWYFVAGCLNQTIWNYLYRNGDVEGGIKDYDIIYFDKNTSYKAEDTIIKEFNNKYSHIKAEFDIKNQARVHKWIKKWGVDMKPLTSCEQAIGSWPICCSCIGIRKEKGVYKIIAPYGLTDSFEMLARPNKMTVLRQSDFEYKTNKWLDKWPELKIIPWN